MKMAIVRTGGKQYLVHENDEIVVDQLNGNKDDKVELETLAVFEDSAVKLGTPSLKDMIPATIVDQVKGDKVRVAKFKAKVRYRKVRGFRAQLSRIKIGTIK